MSDMTFAFVDLAGFTPLTEAHGDEEAANLVARFAGIVRTSLDELGSTSSTSPASGSATSATSSGCTRSTPDGVRPGGAIDPVCRMGVERDGAAGRLRYRGADHWVRVEPGRYVTGD